MPSEAISGLDSICEGAPASRLSLAERDEEVALLECVAPPEPTPGLFKGIALSTTCFASPVVSGAIADPA